MASVGFFSPQSLPVGTKGESRSHETRRESELSDVLSLSQMEEEGEDGRDQETQCVLIRKNAATPSSSEGERTDDEYYVVQREEAADMPLLPGPGSINSSYGYGGISSPISTVPLPGRKRRWKKRHRRRSGHSDDFDPRYKPHLSLSPQSTRYGYSIRGPLTRRRFHSTSALAQEFGTEYEYLLGSRGTQSHDPESNQYSDEESSSSEEGSPPIMKMIYRRTCKDKIKLIVIPLLYFLFFMIAGVFAFYSIEALIESYKHRVRAVQYINVDTYEPIGVALYPEDFATYEGCEFKYADNVAPGLRNLTPLIPSGAPQACNASFNVTYYSKLILQNRTAMLFEGPTLVKLKQSLMLNFSFDTTKREFGAMEFLLFNSWKNFKKMDLEEKQSFLNQKEGETPLYTVPSGFRSWVKMYYIIRHDGGSETNISEFYINIDFSKYNRPSNPGNVTIATDPIVILFEWKWDTYEFITDILSTNIWNTLGALAGIFVTLIKSGEFFYAWVKRLRRERRKKLEKLKELKLERERAMEEFHRQREEKKRTKQLNQSQEKLGLDE